MAFTFSLDATWALHQEANSLDDVEFFGTEAGGKVRSGNIYRYGSEGGYEVCQGLPTDHLEGMVAGSRTAHFVGACLGEHAPMVTVDQALAVQAVIDAIYQSSETGKQVDVTW